MAQVVYVFCGNIHCTEECLYNHYEEPVLPTTDGVIKTRLPTEYKGPLLQTLFLRASCDTCGTLLGDIVTNQTSRKESP